MQVTYVPGSAGSQPFNLFVAGGRLWFLPFSEYYQGALPQVYSTNSYGDDTEAVYDLNYDPNVVYYSQYVVYHFSDVTVMDDIGFFTVAAYDTSYDYDLVQTALVAVDAPQYDVFVADVAYEITALGAFNGELHYGRAGDLYKLAYNGPVPTFVADPAPGSYSRVYGMQEFNGQLYFSAYTISAGAELYVTDGTQAGTQLVA